MILPLSSPDNFQNINAESVEKDLHEPLGGLCG
jgi:hypothetical protein